MNQKVSSIFKALLSSEQRIHIKLLGDSITHGVGGTGFAQDGEPIAANFARNPVGYCWAKLFKAYMEEHYHCTVTNNACTGTRIEFIIEHFDTLVSEQDDLIICMIGTNNRHQRYDEPPMRTPDEQRSRFYENIKALYQKFRDAGKEVIFMANIPASKANEQDGAEFKRLIHMEDINALYEQAAAECGFPMVSLYRRFSEYCYQNNVEVDSLLADGLHPNDRGYDVMFTLLMKEFGLGQEVERGAYMSIKARVENYNGSPAIMIDGTPYPPMMATIRTNQFGVVKLDKEYYKRLGASGVRIFFLICDTEWLVPDGFIKFCEEAEALLEVVPDAYIIPRIGLHPPVEWMENHPDDMMQYSDGKARPFKFVTESYTAMVPGMYSLSSDNWRHDAGVALEALLDKMDALPYADRIIGYFLAAGQTSEWYHKMDFSLRTGSDVYYDMSPAFRKEFGRYLDQKYGKGVKEPDIPDASSRFYQYNVDNEVAKNAKGLAAAPVPPPPYNGTNVGCFLDVDKHMHTADFVYAWHWGVAQSIIYFADLIKKRNADKLVGSFYGAMSMFHDSGNVLATQEIIKSGKVDFLAAPGCYENRQPGGYTGQRELPDSFRIHNTIFIVEDDTRTHAENSNFADFYGVFDEEDTVNVMKRDFGRNICEDLQSWWFDQHHGGGRYKSEVCYDLIAKQQRIARYAYSLDRSKGNEIACLYDAESMAISSHQTCTESIKVMKNYVMNCFGAPFDQYYVDDIDLIPDYKLYIFFNAYALTEEKRAKIKAKLARNHAVALWMYAPGLINPDAEQKIDPKHMEDITGIRMGMRNEKYLAGFKLCNMDHPIARNLEEGHIYGRIDWPLHYNQSAYQEHTTQSYLYPLIYADDPDAKVLGRFCGPKLPALAVKECQDYTSVFCGTKIIQSDVLREIARFAGCHIYSEENDVLYANRNFITLHAAKSGLKQIRLREKCYPYELYEERFYEPGDVINLDMVEGETKMFALLSEQEKPIVR